MEMVQECHLLILNLYEEEDNDSCVRRCHSTLNQRSTFNKPNLSTTIHTQWIKHCKPCGTHGNKDIRPPIHDTKQAIRGNGEVCIIYILQAPSHPQAHLHRPQAEFSPQEQYDMWSPSFRKNSAFDDQFDLSGPYSSMAHIHRNHRRGRDLDLMNRNFSLMIKQLESGEC
ncbi:hypothetical protein Rs2_16803 [Raphanus sativus]|nr:hypothetical protein Rs2_16803 [Raphanus sativus]